MVWAGSAFSSPSLRLALCGRRSTVEAILQWLTRDIAKEPGECQLLSQGWYGINKDENGDEAELWSC